MAERDPAASDGLVADVVMRRFAASRDPALAGAVRDLARAVREDHAALDLASGAMDVDVDALVDALGREPRLCEFLGASEEPARLGAPLVMVDGRFLSLRRLAVAEYRVAAALVRARASALDLPTGVSEAGFASAAAALGDELAAAGTPSPELAAVARRALTRPISFVVGGPGTGKTWLATQVLALLDRALVASGDATATFAVAAPTGKAARRVAETIDRALAGGAFERLVRDRDREGSLHRLLSLHPTRSDPGRRLHHDVIVVDEVSMADLPVLDALVRASAGDARHQPRVLLVGDPYQLASVNVGAVLADAVRPEARDGDLVSELTVVHRTGHRPIIDLAGAVKDGDLARVRALLSSGGVVSARRDVQDPAVLARVIEHARAVGELAAAGDGPGALGELGRRCVLAAHLEGPGSVAWWNAAVGAAHRRRHPVRAGERFSVGEPVLVTRNQRALDLSNGDLGVVVERDGRRVIAFEGGRVAPVGAVGFLQSAWAMTIHKSQGSEFDHVVVALAREQSPLLTRELLYTGVTRASEGVTILGSDEALARAVASPVSRVSALTHRLATWPSPVSGPAG
ncbi:MAG: AAA family ATPase [Acidobacteriota bacterium]|nr:AAA family ATPase [Acidobacteriota bacterium]